jgi:hypothetical protein
MTETEVCLLMQMARWRAVDDADPSLSIMYSMGLPWAQVLKYLGEVYRERAHVLLTAQCRHLFLMSASSPDLLIHLVLPGVALLPTSPPSSPPPQQAVFNMPWLSSTSSAPSSPSLTTMAAASGSADDAADASGGTGQPRLYICRRLNESAGVVEEDRQEEADLTALVNTLCTFLTRLLMLPPSSAK